MKRPEFIRYSCYKFMLQLCIIDMIVISFNAILSGVQTIFGLHFCTNPRLFYVIGSIGTSGWYAASMTSVLLALDRFFEMTWSRGAAVLFEGKRFFVWTVLTIFYVLFTFTQHPAVYNTKYYAYFMDPFIGTLGLQFSPQFSDLTFHIIHNITVVVLLGTIYTTLCLIYLTKFRFLMNVKVNTNQKLLTIQALCICVEFFVAALVYVFMQLFEVSEFIIIMGHVSWILMHGDTPIVYLILNKSLRNAVLRMFRVKNDMSRINEHVYQVPLPNNRVANNSIY